MKSTGSSTSSSRARLANPSPLPGIDWGSTESQVSCGVSCVQPETSSKPREERAPDTWSGRTFLAHCQADPKARRGKISDACSQPWMNSGSVFRGEYSTLNLPEYQTGKVVSGGRLRSAAGVSTLSEALERRAARKYSLSALACEGIIRRAEQRGKPLPPMLKSALEQVIARG